MKIPCPYKPGDKVICVQDGASEHKFSTLGGKTLTVKKVFYGGEYPYLTFKEAPQSWGLGGIRPAHQYHHQPHSNPHDTIPTVATGELTLTLKEILWVQVCVLECEATPKPGGIPDEVYLSLDEETHLLGKIKDLIETISERQKEHNSEHERIARIAELKKIVREAETELETLTRVPDL